MLELLYYRFHPSQLTDHECYGFSATIEAFLAPSLFSNYTAKMI